MSKQIQADQVEQVYEYNEEVLKHRNPDYPVHPIILNRWSSRSFANELISEEQLYTVLEAARWAPSGSNAQPWRFYVATSDEEKGLFQQFINPRNRQWTDQAPVLLLLASATVNEEGKPLFTHAFDAGAAWATLALQANILGLSTRAVGGYDKEKARLLLGTPDNIELHAVIGLGVRGTLEDLDESFHSVEKPSSRKPLRENVLPIDIK